MKIGKEYLKKIIIESIEEQLKVEAESPAVDKKEVSSTISLSNKTPLFKGVISRDHASLPINGPPLISKPQFQPFLKDYKNTKAKYLVFLQDDSSTTSFTLHEIKDADKQIIGPAFGNGATIDQITLRSSGIYVFKGDVAKLT